MSQNTMLYKHGGEHKIHGDDFSFIIVDADENGAIEEALSKGWHLTTTEAKLGKIDSNDDGEVTRAELEAKAIELEIPFRSNTKDETILKAINEKLGENDE